MQESLNPRWIGVLRRWTRSFTSGDCGRGDFFRSRGAGLTVLLGLVAAVLGPMSAVAQVPPCLPSTPQYPCVYATDNGGDSNAAVVVINASTRDAVDFVPLDSSDLQGLAVTPDNAFVYVADRGNGRVDLIDTASNSVTAIDIVGGSPSQISITPNGDFAYVVGLGLVPGAPTGFVQVIDTRSNQVIVADTISGLQNPTAVAFAPNGAFAYVADVCITLACVQVIDTFTHTIMATVQIPGTIGGSTASIAVSPDGSLVCLSVTNDAKNIGVALIDTSNNAFLDTLQIADSGRVSNHGFEVTPDGILYAAVQPNPAGVAGIVVPIKLSSRAVGNQIGVGKSQAIGPSVSLGASGTLLYVTNTDDNTVSVIKISTNTLTFSIDAGGPRYVASMSLSPPIITTQPASQAINPGQTATLNVIATNIAPLSYQWFQGQSGDASAPIAGANSSSFTTPALSVATSYWVLVSNIAGSVDSNTATVTMNRPPTCSLAIQGSGPSDPFTITAVVNCIDPQGSPLTTTIFWGDDTSTTTDGGSVVVTHTYANDGIYQLNVSAIDGSELRGEVPAVVNLLALTAPLPILPGQTSDVPVVVLGFPANLRVTFECTTVTDSHGTVSQAVDLGITCSSIPAPLTLTGARQPVDILLHTTGAAVGAIVPGKRPRNLLYALWLPLPCLVVWSLGIGTLRIRRVSIRWVWLSAALALGMLLPSCGGGFTAPGGQAATPSGNYRVTVIDRPVEGQSLTGFVQTSLIVPLSVM